MTSPELCTVRIIVSDGFNRLSGVEVSAQLIGRGNQSIDETIIAPRKLTATTDASGVADLALIPSALFTRGGEYSLVVVEGDRLIFERNSVRVPTAPLAFVEDLQ